MTLQDYERQRAEALLAGRRLFESDPDVEKVVAVVAAWFTISSKTVRAARREGERLVTLAAELRSAGFLTWAARMEVVGNRSSDEVERIAGQQLLSAAANVIAASASHPDFTVLVNEIACLCMDLEVPNGTDLLHCFQKSDGGLDRLHDVLVARIQQGSARVVREHFRREPPAGPEATRDIWPSHHFEPVRDSWAYQVVRQLDPARFLGLVEKVPRSVAHSLIEETAPLSHSDLIDLLGRCEPAYLPDEMLGSGRAIFAVLTAVGEYLRRCAGLADKVDLSLPPLNVTMGDTLSALFKRTDAQPLARAWLQQLFWEQQNFDCWRDRQAGAGNSLAAISQLTKAIASRLVPLGGKTMLWIAAEEPLWRVCRVLVEASVLSLSGHLQDAGHLLADSLSQNLVTTWGRETALLGDTLEARIVGDVVSGQVDATQWFEVLWLAIYDHRERGRLMALFSDSDGRSLPGHVALAWGVIGANRLQDGRRAAELWNKLAGAIIETQVTEVGLGERPLLYASTVAAGLVGARLELQGDLPMVDFTKFVFGLTSPTIAFCKFVAALVDNGSIQPLLQATHQIGKQRVCDMLDIVAAHDGEKPSRRLATTELKAIRQLQSAL